MPATAYRSALYDSKEYPRRSLKTRGSTSGTPGKAVSSPSGGKAVKWPRATAVSRDIHKDRA